MVERASPSPAHLLCSPHKPGGGGGGAWLVGPGGVSLQEGEEHSAIGQPVAENLKREGGGGEERGVEKKRDQRASTPASFSMTGRGQGMPVTCKRRQLSKFEQGRAPCSRRAAWEGCSHTQPSSTQGTQRKQRHPATIVQCFLHDAHDRWLPRPSRV